MLCKECKKEIEFNYGKELNNQMKQRQLCFYDDFWYDYYLRKDEPEIVRINNNHYVIGDENAIGNRRWRGFYGDKFIIIKDNGTKIITTNLWHQGEIPEHWRERLPNNATFEEE